MSSRTRPGALQERVIQLAVVMAVLTAVSYLLMGLDVLGVGDLAEDEAPPGITYVAAGGYLLGGALVLLRRRWLWVTGAVLNGLIMLMFFTSYADRSSVLLSAGGVVSKATEILLEVCLVYLVATYSSSSRDDARPLARTAL